MLHEILDIKDFDTFTLAGARVLKLNRFRENAAGFTLLLFVPGKPCPEYVVKAFNRGMLEDFLRTEHDNLRLLQGVQDEEFRLTVPAAVRYDTTAQHCYLIQTGLRGTPLKSIPARTLLELRKSVRLLRNITDWSIRMAQLLVPNMEEQKDIRSEMAVTGMVNRYLHCYLHSPGEKVFLEEMADIAVSYVESQDRLFFAHNDFCTSNILFELPQFNVKVFDWEAPLTPQLPLYDLFHFYSCLAENLADETTGDHPSYFSRLKSFFFEDNPFSNHVRTEFQRFAGQFKISGNTMLALYTMYWIHNALEKHDYFSDHQGSSDEKILRIMEKERKPVSSCRVKDGKLLNIKFLMENSREWIFGRS